jgi:hypothetical protein
MVKDIVWVRVFAICLIYVQFEVVECLDEDFVATWISIPGLGNNGTGAL